MSLDLHYRSRLNRRTSRRQKYSRAAALVILAIAVAVSSFLGFVFPLLTPGVSSWPLPGFNYYALLQQSLPGLGLEILDPEARPDPGGLFTTFSFSFQNYPQYLMSRELSGFKVLDMEQYLEEDAAIEKQSPVYYSPESGPEPKLEPLGPHSPVDEMEIPARVQKIVQPASLTAPVVSSEAPRVLIYHTHTTESFVPETGMAFSEDMEKTVVVLGKDLAETLQHDYGIPVLHITEIFDIPRREGYRNSLPRIKEILEENPQVDVVLDIHRDGVPRAVTTKEIEGEPAGRLLFVVGASHERWNQNMRFALFLQKRFEEQYPGLSRGVRKHDYVYNQHLHERSLIVEIGGHENTLQEVRNTIPYLAEVIADAFSYE